MGPTEVLKLIRQVLLGSRGGRHPLPRCLSQGFQKSLVLGEEREV